jgi:hypothetical protein
MKDELIGYASIMLSDFNNPIPSAYTIWETSDGGLSWTDVTGNIHGGATCVYSTSSATTITSWNILGGVSITNGVTIPQTFTGQTIHKSNGIDFLDDKNGVVTMGPDLPRGGNVASSYTYYTNDGGVTWKRGGLMHESWGVYAEKSSSSFFSLAEDEQGNPGNSVYHSINNGRNWTRITSLANLEFTGHIAGGGTAIYVQTSSASNVGLMRSDDHGTTWRNVGGPSNERDTRFAVTGCRGEIVYAFDNTGGIWKTTNGGDGTLVPTPYIGSLPSVKPSDGLLMPVYYDTIDLPVAIQELKGTITLNDNLLQPDSLAFNYTQFYGKTKFDTVYQTSPGQWTYDIVFKNNIQLTGSESLPLFFIYAKAFLSDTNETDVGFTANIVNAGKPTLLASCTGVPTPHFVLQMVCGDTTLYQYMRGMLALSVFSVRPNPAQGKITLSSRLPAASSLEVTFYDTKGNAIATKYISAPAGISDETVPVNDINSGMYILQIKCAEGTVYHQTVVIER